MIASEAITASLLLAMTTVVVSGYGFAWAGVLRPSVVAAIGVTALIAAALTLTKGRGRDAGAAAACALVFAVAAVILMRLSPALLPLGTGPDLAHHLTLIEFLERTHRLPVSSELLVLGEMTHYTPGAHLLAVTFGWLARLDGLHGYHLTVVAAVALKCVLIVLIVRRLTAATLTGMTAGVAAIVLGLLPVAYSVHVITRESFFAQLVAELFAIAMWWSVVVWQQHQSRLALLLFAAFGCATFLTWPIWMGPPIVLLLLVFLSQRLGIAEVGGNLAWALVPIALIVILHSAGRVGWFRMAGTTGFALAPAWSLFPKLFVVMAAIGVAVAAFTPRARTAAWFAAAIVLQGAALWGLATMRGASTPYMAYKMVYLLIWPLAVAAAVALAHGLERLSIRNHAAAAVIIVLTAVVAATAQRPLRPHTVITPEFVTVAQSARAQLPANCIDYIVRDAHTSYWMHLAVFNEPRASARTVQDDTFDMRRAIGRWINEEGLTYAIADTRIVPKELMNRVDVLLQQGNAAVLRRRSGGSCPQPRQ